MKSRRLFFNLSLLGANLAALMTTFFQPAMAADAQTNLTREEDRTITLNQSSLKSIESSWLEVPRVCKAKGFNAEPVTVIHQPLPAAVAALYDLRVG